MSERQRKANAIDHIDNCSRPENCIHILRITNAQIREVLDRLDSPVDAGDMNKVAQAVCNEMGVRAIWVIDKGSAQYTPFDSKSVNLREIDYNDIKDQAA